METLRKPFQGVLTIIRFNWHFYLISFGLICILILIGAFFDSLFFITFLTSSLIALPIFISLIISFYIYDLSNLYKLSWVPRSKISDPEVILNIHAGFDETSGLIQKKYPSAKVTVLDFYDPNKHTEISIKRARKAVRPYPNTLSIATSDLPIANNSVDLFFLFLSAHEIRNTAERGLFFAELRRVIKPTGRIILTEHLRDHMNFAAYNIGFLHFLSRKTWKNTFNKANLSVNREIKTTPFITTFILNKNGITS